MAAMRSAVGGLSFGASPPPPPPAACAPAPASYSAPGGAAPGYAAESCAPPSVECKLAAGGGDAGGATFAVSACSSPVRSRTATDKEEAAPAAFSAEGAVSMNDELADDLAAPMDLEGYGAPGQAVSGPGTPPLLPPPIDDREALRQLNHMRSTEGCWALTDALLALLVSRGSPAGGAAADALRSAQPDGVGDAEWATLLVTAFLRKRLGSEKGVWAAMESKAVTWLGSRWKPAEGSSLGAATIAAMKLL